MTKFTGLNNRTENVSLSLGQSGKKSLEEFYIILSLESKFSKLKTNTIVMRCGFKWEEIVE